MDRSTLSYRKAEMDDIPRIIELLLDDALGSSREKKGEVTDPTYIAAFEAIDKDPHQFLAVVEKGGRIIGCLQISFIPGLSRLGMWRGQIESVRICKSERGHGYGEAFFQWAIAQCKERGCGLVQLTSDKQRKDAYRFYERLGFVASHEGFKLDLL